MSDIKIYVCAHKSFDVPTDHIYIPLQVGAALHEDLGYVSDATGDNISEKNLYYSELTGLYWMWKNAPECDYTGLCHYRRYFLDEHHQRLTAEQIEQCLSHYDLISTGCAMLRKPDTVWQHYGEHHHIEDLEHTRQAIAGIFPEDLELFDAVMQGQEMYFGNMMIGPKSLVDAYAQWLFAILFEVEKHTDLSRYDDYDKRVFGFLSERLLMVWIKKMGLRVCSLEVDVTGDKAETSAAKQKAVELLETGDENAVLDYLQQLEQTRPDLFEDSSDRDGTLWIVRLFAEIMAFETRIGIENLKKYSTKFDELLSLRASLYELFYGLPDQGQLYEFVMNRKLSYESIIFFAQILIDEWEINVRVDNYFAERCLDQGDLFHAKLFLDSAMQLAQKHGEGV